MHDRADALRDDDLRRRSVVQADLLTQARVRLVVERARGIVQHEDLRAAGQRAGDQQPLLLPAGQVRALDGHRRVQPALRLNKVERLRAARGLEQLLVRKAAAEADVLADRIFKQRVVLEHDAELRAQVGRRIVADVDAVDLDRARLDVVVAHQGADNRRLARAGRADDAERFAALQRKVEAAHREAAAVVAERHVAERDVRRVFRQKAVVRLGLVKLDRRVEHLEHAGRGGRRAGKHREHAVDRHQCVQHDREQVHERDDLADLGRAVVDAHGARRDDGDDAEVQKQAHDRVDQRHRLFGGALLFGQVVVDALEAFALIRGFRERLDDADAGGVFAHDAQHGVRGFLHDAEKPRALARDVERDRADNRQRRHHDQRQNRVERQRDDHAADEQDRRANAEALDHADRLVQNVGVARHARDQRRDRELVDALFRQVRDLAEQVVPDLPRAVARDGGGHAVRRDVADPREQRADDHQAAPHADRPDFPERDQIVDDIR